MKKIVYFLGNPLVQKDRLPIKIIPKLQKFFPDIAFVHFDPTEEIEFDKEKEFIFIDTVIGTKKVTIFHSLNQWAISPRISPHDFDLPLQLGLMKKLKKITKITIIGIPEKGKLKAVKKQLFRFLSSIHPNHYTCPQNSDHLLR